MHSKGRSGCGINIGTIVLQWLAEAAMANVQATGDAVQNLMIDCLPYSCRLALRTLGSG